VRYKAWVCCRSPGKDVDSNPVGGMAVSLFFECCALSGRGLCVELITRLEVSYTVSEFDHESSIMRRPWPPGCVSP
jgi:hypothetical protein